MTFLKVPVAVLDFGLSPNELKIYLYLLACKNRLNTATVRVSTIQQRCAIGSRSTVHSALCALEQKQLLVRTQRRDPDGYYRANRYDLTEPHGAWFAIDLSAQLWQLDKSAFVVYLHLLRLCRSNGRAWPSYTAIARALGLARNTVIAAIRRLQDLGWLFKAFVRRGKHNLYALFSGQKERAAVPETQPQPYSTNKKSIAQTSRFILSFIRTLVNRVFSTVKHLGSMLHFWGRRGSAKTGQQYIDLSIYIKEKKSLRIPKPTKSSFHPQTFLSQLSFRQWMDDNP